LKSKYFQAYNDLIGFVSHWETGFEFEDLPVNAKKALLDMAYNMGITKLMKFHDMFEAIQQKDWETAAKECLDSVYSKVDLKKSNRDEENAELLRSCLDSNPADDNLT
jgi:GH24 family phage-related lysozyme (muramidase)